LKSPGGLGLRLRDYNVLSVDRKEGGDQKKKIEVMGLTVGSDHPKREKVWEEPVKKGLGGCKGRSERKSEQRGGGKNCEKTTAGKEGGTLNFIKAGRERTRVTRTQQASKRRSGRPTFRIKKRGVQLEEGRERLQVKA